MNYTKSKELLTVEHLVKRFPAGRTTLADRLLRRKQKWLTAVDDVSFTVQKGETLAVLGESGSGKTTLGRLIVGLEKPDSGRILLEGKEIGHVKENPWQRGLLQMVFQDPASSLDPYLTVEECVAEPLTNTHYTTAEKKRKVAEALSLVGLDTSLATRTTRELSGGQKQRVAIARAIISEPKLIVLDEPTTSIDVTLQAQILNLLVELQEAKELTYLLITHDPAVARFLADRVAIMYLGKIVEIGPATKTLTEPKHPYTQALLASVPKIGGQPPNPIQGDPPSPTNPPKGCRYQPRCPYAFETCTKSHPPLLPKDEEAVACYLYAEKETI